MCEKNLTEKTLADVQAGIPARDAEIEALRKENAELREQLEAVGAGGVNGRLMPGTVSAEPVGYVSKQAIERFQDGRHADIYPSIEELTHEFFDATPMALYADSFAVQAQPITAADAVYGLLAWLSGRDEVVTLSARHGAAIAADLAKAFCEENGLQQFSQDYPDNLKYPKSALEQQPVSGADQFRDAAQMIEPSGKSGELEEREAFEDWAKNYGYQRDELARSRLRLVSVKYFDHATEHAWEVWQARAALAQQDATLHAEVLDMVRMLEANEWADHCGESELGQRLEWAITALQNRLQNIPEIIPEPAQQDAETGKSVSVENQRVTQREADKVDAERYRYLRGYRGHKATGVLIKGILFNGHESLARTDEAIDAARKEPDQ